MIILPIQFHLYEVVSDVPLIIYAGLQRYNFWETVNQYLQL